MVSTAHHSVRSGAGPTAQRWAVVLLAFLGWFAAALTVEDCYPFGRFEFFRTKMDTARRVFVRTPAGALADPMAFADWHCDSPIAPEPEFIDGSMKAALVYMEHHQGPASAGPPVEVIERRWRFEDGVAQPEVTDTTLFHCTARPVDTRWQFTLWQRY